MDAAPPPHTDRSAPHRTGTPPSASSPLDAAAQRVGDRWSLLLVEALLRGAQRFGELQDAVDGIAPNILSRRLKHLEAERVVIARRYSDRPPRYEYALTAAGRELAGALRLLAHWGGAGLDDADAETTVEPVRHAVCGTPAETRWWCPTCGRLLDDGEADELHHV